MCGNCHSSLGRRVTAPSFSKPLTLLIAAVVGTALFSAQASAQVNFTQNAVPSGDYSTQSIVSGDFNNDGILDLVTFNPTTFSFYKGLGGGNFANAVNQPMPTNNGAGGPAFAADLNGDGNLDIVASYGAFGPDSVVVLLGNGDGTFTQGTDISTTNSADAIVLADFNGDHKPDLAVSNAGSATTWIYLGNGDGTFKLSATLSGGGGSIVAADFNLDKKQDLAFAAGDRQHVGVFLGNGDGTFSVTPVLAAVSFVQSIAVGDFFTKRMPALVALGGVLDSNGNNFDSYVYSLEFSNGQLNLESQALVGQFSAGGPLFITAGDLNGDYKMDVFLAGGSINSNGYTAYMLGNGDGTFQTAQLAPNNNAGIAYVFPFIRDLDLDSRHDAAMAWQSMDIGGAEVLLNTSASLACTPPPANKLSVHVCALASGQSVGRSFTFTAAGNSFNGVVKRMELWIDGKKVGQNLEDQLKVTTSLTQGNHTAKFAAVDSFDNVASTSVNFSSN